MLLLFPHYGVHVECSCTASDVIISVLGIVALPDSKFKVDRSFNSGPHGLLLSTVVNHYWFHNSFVPVICIDVNESATGASVDIQCSLKRGTKIILLAFYLFAFLIEAVLLTLFVTNRLATPVLLGFPIGMVLFCLILSNIGLKVSSREALNELLRVINSKNDEYWDMEKA